MSDRPAISPEDSAQAAEYVLGLLDAEARAGFEVRLLAEPALLGEVRHWQAHFATMADVEVEAVTPPPQVQKALEARLFPDVVATSLWDRVAFWRGLSLATGALASLAIGVALLPDAQLDGPGGDPVGIPEGRLLMTHLIPTEGSTLGLAVTREPSGVLQVRRVAGDMAEGRAQELWLIVGEDAPISLGVLGDDPLTTLSPTEDLAQLFAAGAALAISDEPLGGSPTGAPTGDILAIGTLIAL